MSQIFNPVKLLTDVSASHANGQLQVTNNQVTWKIYIENGQIKCAANSVQQLMITLDYHLRFLGLQNAAATMKSMSVSAGKDNSLSSNWLEGGKILPSINLLISRKHLSLNETQNIFKSLSLEALETFLWLREGEYKWNKNVSLPQHALATKVEFKNIDTADSIQKIRSNIASWKPLTTSISSPHQRPYLKENQALTESSTPVLLKLAKFLKGLSFRQLSLILNQDEIKVAKLLHASIQSGEVVVHSPQFPFDLLPSIPIENLTATPTSKIQSEVKLKVACIDDSPTILDEMQRFLSTEAYEITRIEDPLKAAPILLRLKPDLILMDISMPNINGYKLCSFFRGSPSLKKVPIIMVSGRTGFIDKTRAKMVGATDYLTKPFSKPELLSVVNKYLSQVKVSS